jgi:hypothetical protein
MPGEIARLKDAIQTAPDTATRSGLEGNLAQAEAYLAELRSMTPPVPTRTVSQTVTLQEAGARSSSCCSAAGTPTATCTSTCRRKPRRSSVRSARCDALAVVDIKPLLGRFLDPRAAGGQGQA